MANTTDAPMVSRDDCIVFDIEANGLTPDKIYCLAANEKGKLKSTVEYERMKNLLTRAKVLVGHNIIRWDIPNLERLLGIKIKALLVDTLPLSWYLYPDNTLHGLEYWGEYFGVEKPPIDDWHNLTIEEYVHRCREDVKINTALWEKMWAYLKTLYKDEEQIWNFLVYMSKKMDGAREQERSGWKLDVLRCERGLAELEQARAEKVIELSQAMPKVPIIAKREKPAKPFKKDGTLSATGAKWKSLLREHNLPENYDGVVEVVVNHDEPNPGSHVQIKNWLFSLGWKPATFKYQRDKETGNVRQIPQVNSDDSDGLCPSVRLLFDREPSLELLDGLGILSHRISILRGFLDNVDGSGRIMAQIQGLTNTLRFKHKTAVNLPGVQNPYGELIRGCLIADEGYELCGSDMSGLEDRLKQHYIYHLDPDYVNEMNVPNYDPHLSLALLAGKVTDEDVDLFKTKDKSEFGPNAMAQVGAIKVIRHTFKQGNYACQYGAGVSRLALTAGITEAEAKVVHITYWKKNWSIKQAAKEQVVRTVNGQMWLLNPISGFYYSLRYEKDIFSTLVQGTAAYVFDKWIEIFRERRPQLTAQFHDEVVLHIKKGHREACEQLLRGAIKQLNDQLKLNRSLDIDVQFGDDYASIH